MCIEHIGLRLRVSLCTGHHAFSVELSVVRVHLVLHLEEALHLEVLDSTLAVHALGATHDCIDLHPVVGLHLVLLLLQNLLLQRPHGHVGVEACAFNVLLRLNCW